LIKSDKDIYISNAVLSIFLFIKKSYKKCIMVSIKILSNTMFSTLVIRNSSLAPNQHIRMMFEGSCDTED